MTDVPDSHPRSVSLRTRDMIVSGVEKGVTSVHGLIAHGRGEAFDYLIGEKTHSFATEAIDAAAAQLLLAQYPVFSVNGNVAALVPQDIITLVDLVSAKLEVNIFHAANERDHKILEHFKSFGVSEILIPQPECILSYIDSNRRFAHEHGTMKADVVFVPLEDGDRCEALEKMGKRVITIDLNPLSRTAVTASITIVDNVCRALSLLCQQIREFKVLSRDELREKLRNYDNQQQLKEAERCVRSGVR